MGTDRTPAHYRNAMRRAVRRLRAGQITGEQLANDVDAYLRCWDQHNHKRQPA